MGFKLDDYSLKSALLWGNCYGHLKKTQQGSFGTRCVHALISFIEAIPLIGQVASLFEMFIANQAKSSTDLCKKKISHKLEDSVLKDLGPKSLISETSNVETGVDRAKLQETYENFKKRVVEQLPAYIAQEKVQKSYTRSSLIPLNEKRKNDPAKIAKAPDGIAHFSNCTHYTYNGEGIDDNGWGCAWRAIQTCLSGYNLFWPFEHLFHLYGREDVLKTIYTNKYLGEKEIDLSGCAPYNLGNGWAEPFICHMVMEFLGIPSRLLLINGQPAGCHAPAQVFHHNKSAENPPLTYKNFKDKLDEHFKKTNASPVMIDDGFYALNIIGVGENKLWIADPHINPGVSTRNSPVGTYTIDLDKDGNFNGSSLTQDQLNKVMYGQGAHIKGLTFSNKSWMVLLPD